jgi:hypothetical protein
LRHRRMPGFLTGNVLLPSWKDGPNGLLESVGMAASVLVLGDASRGALYLALPARGEHWGEPVATTPRAAGSIPHFFGGQPAASALRRPRHAQIENATASPSAAP